MGRLFKIFIAAFSLAFALTGSYIYSIREHVFPQQPFLEKHPVRQIGFWQTRKSRPLHARIEVAPQEVLDFMTEVNKQGNYSEIPQAPDKKDRKKVSDFIADVKFAVAGLQPKKISKIADENIFGILIVKNLGSSAFSTSVTDMDSNIKGGIILLDFDRLNTTANEWATYKENTPFSAKVGFALSAKIADPVDDNRRTALQYILLHEISHVLAFGSTIHPEADFEPSPAFSFNKFEFVAQSWLNSKGMIISKFDSKFPIRTYLSYYQSHKDRPGLDLARPIYNDLKKTNFVNLYATTNFYDDFAETLTGYVHSVVLKRPWEIRIKSEKDIYIYGHCWQEKRCLKKRRYIENLLEIKSPTAH